MKRPTKRDLGRACGPTEGLPAPGILAYIGEKNLYVERQMPGYKLLTTYRPEQLEWAIRKPQAAYNRPRDSERTLDRARKALTRRKP